MNKPCDSLLFLHRGASLRICCFRESLTELAVRLIDSGRSRRAPDLQHLLSLSNLEAFQGQFEREEDTYRLENRLIPLLTEFSHRFCEGSC